MNETTMIKYIIIHGLNSSNQVGKWIPSDFNRYRLHNFSATQIKPISVTGEVCITFVFVTLFVLGYMICMDKNYAESPEIYGAATDTPTASLLTYNNEPSRCITRGIIEDPTCNRMGSIAGNKLMPSAPIPVTETPFEETPSERSYEDKKIRSASSDSTEVYSSVSATSSGSIDSVSTTIASIKQYEPDTETLLVNNSSDTHNTQYTLS